jgi:pyrimidine operon attenuation protein/uracil phosphoribosyltransferase
MSSIDAEALYRAVLEQIRTACGDALGKADGAVLVGIHSGGAWLAARLARDLKVATFGVVNVSLHRDDYAKKGLHAQASPTSLPFDVSNRHIVLVDDVLYTGRTVRAALNELYDYGRPASVELAVLADRGGRELPVAARFVGGVVDVGAGSNLVLAREDTPDSGDEPRFTFHVEARATSRRMQVNARKRK